MSTSNQQTLADLGANERPPMLERGNYIPWESRFRRFLDNKLEEGEQVWNSIQNGPYVRLMILDLDGDVNINGTVKQIIKPLSKMTKGNKKQYIADVKVMNYLLQAIPNDIYNSVDACKNAKEIKRRIRTTCSSIQSKESLPKNHDPLALIAHSNASSSQSHANSSYSSQPYYVTHLHSIVDYEDEFQGSYKGHYARDSQKPRVRDAKYFREQMLLAMKDEAGSNLNNEENDSCLDTSCGEENYGRVNWLQYVDA
ncbi:hypothetical protein Tco_0072257 [Tanacetum coccineum]